MGDSQRDSQRDSRESFTIETLIFIARQADSPESLEFPIGANHATKGQTNDAKEGAKLSTDNALYCCGSSLPEKRQAEAAQHNDNNGGNHTDSTAIIDDHAWTGLNDSTTQRLQIQPQLGTPF